jgi:hypothetical protein
MKHQSGMARQDDGRLCRCCLHEEEGDELADGGELEEGDEV